MNVNLKITACAFIDADTRSSDLDEKRIVPKMMLRRRLTRGSKILLYLSDVCNYSDGAVVFGSAYGEVEATASIVHAINDDITISPTAFQNSVYNTPVSYFSLHHKNASEILTLANGDETSRDVLQTAALQALYHKEIFCVVVEAFDIEGIDDMNSCNAKHEMGVAFKMEITQEDANIELRDSTCKNLSASLRHMKNLFDDSEKTENPIVRIKL